MSYVSRFFSVARFFISCHRQRNFKWNGKALLEKERERVRGRQEDFFGAQKTAREAREREREGKWQKPL